MYTQLLDRFSRLLLLDSCQKVQERKDRQTDSTQRLIRNRSELDLQREPDFSEELCSDEDQAVVLH